MSATETQPRYYSIGAVERELEAEGLARCATTIRNLERRGVVRPLRVEGYNRRLYTDRDIAALKAAIRSGHEPEAA